MIIVLLEGRTEKDTADIPATISTEPHKLHEVWKQERELVAVSGEERVHKRAQL